LSIPGAFALLVDKMLMGTAFTKGLTLRMGQTHVHRYLRPLLQHIENGAIDPTFVISHRLPLGQAADAYAMFSPTSKTIASRWY
jgi:threonine dehydrogenase-like Zn-dependent dehydrogenase